MKRVVVGLSGGVDSSVAAYLLQQQGYEVLGIFMRNWHDESVTINNECPWIDDSNDAMLVAEKLGIPFQVMDLSIPYKERIVDYMFSEYEKGRTPNPDVLCNREIKFDIFLKAAIQLNADFVATGHYCRKSSFLNSESKEIHQLLAGVDNNKDQSYFLCQLSQEQLSKAIFPIGELTKPEVRAIAKELDLVTADKKDSQGLCFIGKVKLPTFLQQQLEPKPGRVIQIPSEVILSPEVVDYNSKIPLTVLKAISHPYPLNTNQGKDVGEHNGAHYYTIGQRKGLGIGGTAEPLFVIGTDTTENIIYTGLGESHPGLWRQALYVIPSEIHWIRTDLALTPGQKLSVQARIRYRQELQDATIFCEEDGVYVVFKSPQKSITPGQFVAFYLETELIGSGIIHH